MNIFLLILHNVKGHHFVEINKRHRIGGSVWPKYEPKILRIWDWAGPFHMLFNVHNGSSLLEEMKS